jgi:UTP--glucose-1-phosphate uridylyltransferase
MVDRFQELETTLIGLQQTPESEIGRFGTVGGSWVDGESDKNIINITIFKEKPDPEFALEYLVIEGLPERSYLTVFGLYLLTPGVFEELEKAAQECTDEAREVQLTDALEEFRHRERILGLVVNGEKVDIGLPEGYLDGLMKFSGRS